MPRPRILPEPLTAYRIGDAEGLYPAHSAEGARRTGGRWSMPGQAVIYASEHYSMALLEKLVRLGELPPRQHSVEITIPAGTSYEVVTEATVPGWYERGGASARVFGSGWLEEGRSAILLVPSVVARGAQHPHQPRASGPGRRARGPGHPRALGRAAVRAVTARGQNTS